MYIACPKCDWRPDERAFWFCSCGHSWHTFSTHGICPACGKVWSMTECLTHGFGGCGRWSDHEDWYHQDDELTVQEYLYNPLRAREITSSLRGDGEER